MKPSGIHHVSINVSNADASIAFYTTMLGATVRSDRPDFGPGAWLDFGPQQVHLIEAVVPPNNGQHFAIGVTTLDEAVAELRDKGVKVDGPVDIGTRRQAFLTDPDGNPIELHAV